MLRGDFLRLFVGDAVSTFGSVVSALAIQFLLIDTLRADEQAIGFVRAAQWAPYLLFGLLAGVIAERFRRRQLLIGADVVGFVVFGSIGVLALTGALTVWLLAALVFVFGAVTCLSVAAYQSYVPRLVPERALPDAFARLEQMGQSVGSVGPLAAGSLVRFLSAPIAILVDALSYAVSALCLLTIRTREPGSPPERRRIIVELREGARWVYRHQTLRPYALWLHAWFFGRAMVTTVLVYYASVELGLDALTVGLALAGAGVSPRPAGWLGLGRPGRGPGARRTHRDQRFAHDDLPDRRHAGPVAGQDERHDPHLQLGWSRPRLVPLGVGGGALGEPDRHARRRRTAPDRHGIPAPFGIPRRRPALTTVVG